MSKEKKTTEKIAETEKPQEVETQQQKQQQAQKQTLVLVVSRSDSAEVVELSIAAWRKNFADAEIVIVSAKKDGIKTLDFVPSEDKNVNLANILAAAIADEEVSEKFILSPIDAFPVNKIGWQNLEILKCKSQLLQNKRLICLKDLTELAVTEQLKKENIKDVVNFETGLPVVFEKEKLIEIFQKFNPQKIPTKVISLYLNYHYSGFSSKPVYFRAGIFATAVMRKEANLDVVKEGLEVSDFFIINTDGYIAAGKLIAEKLAND
ncbi:MAG: hypothetical protein LBS50_06935 [Prevotellaceae bacterium]|jgi:hypothetical protein|nr:hypothetical protein [Prevotellaceae bacterium]